MATVVEKKDDREPLTVCTNVTRPAANTVQPGVAVWNLDDKAPNWSDGTDWRDSKGNKT